MTTIKIKLVDGGIAPKKAHESDSCYDAYAREVVHTPNYIAYKLGFMTEIPEGWEGRLYSRSSVSKKHLQQCNGVGVIDQDYRGEWEIRFNLAAPNYLYYKMNGLEEPSFDDSNIYKVGEAVAQFQFRKKEETELELVVDIETDTVRGDGGFGSTDTKEVLTDEK
jgi:dUTPase